MHVFVGFQHEGFTIFDFICPSVHEINMCIQYLLAYFTTQNKTNNHKHRAHMTCFVLHPLESWPVAPSHCNRKSCLIKVTL